MRWFVRQSDKGGQVCAFNQYYNTKNCDDNLKIISEELDVKGNIYDIIEAYENYKNKHFKIIEKEHEKQFDYYRDADVDEKEEYIIRTLSQLPSHQLIKQIKLVELIWDYDAVSLYPSAMWDENSVYPRIETGYAFTKDMKDELVEKLNSGNSTRGSVILKIKYYNPQNLFVQHVLVKERKKN